MTAAGMATSKAKSTPSTPPKSHEENDDGGLKIDPDIMEPYNGPSLVTWECNIMSWPILTKKRKQQVSSRKRLLKKAAEKAVPPSPLSNNGDDGDVKAKSKAKAKPKAKAKVKAKAKSKRESKEGRDGPTADRDGDDDDDGDGGNGPVGCARCHRLGDFDMGVYARIQDVNKTMPHPELRDALADSIRALLRTPTGAALNDVPARDLLEASLGGDSLVQGGPPVHPIQGALAIMHAALPIKV